MPIKIKRRSGTLKKLSKVIIMERKNGKDPNSCNIHTFLTLAQLFIQATQ